jgi:hypothetical protein
MSPNNLTEQANRMLADSDHSPSILLRNDIDDFVEILSIEEEDLKNFLVQAWDTAKRHSPKDSHTQISRQFRARLVEGSHFFNDDVEIVVSNNSVQVFYNTDLWSDIFPSVELFLEAVRILNQNNP